MANRQLTRAEERAKEKTRKEIEKALGWIYKRLTWETVMTETQLRAVYGGKIHMLAAQNLPAADICKEILKDIKKVS